jgi:hypothetical protein
MEDNLSSEITTDQTDTTPFPDIYDLKKKNYSLPSNYAPIALTITLSSISYLTGREEDGH